MISVVLTSNYKKKSFSYQILVFLLLWSHSLKNEWTWNSEIIYGWSLNTHNVLNFFGTLMKHTDGIYLSCVCITCECGFFSGAIRGPHRPSMRNKLFPPNFVCEHDLNVGCKFFMPYS